MAYILKKRTEEDKEIFLKCGFKSPFGGVPSFGCYIVENVNEDIKMALLGGQGNMLEDGTEISDMAAYCVVLWKKKKFLLEYYSCSKSIVKNKEYEQIYKLKEVYTGECSDEEKEEFVKIAKKCFVAYGNGGARTYICKKISFTNEKVRWR